MDMIEALRLLAGRSPAATNEAVDTMEALRRRSPMTQQRYNRTVALAFRDPEATFTPEERADIAALLDTGAGESRDQTFQIRVTTEEKERIYALAEAAGMPASEYARRLLLGGGGEE